MEAIALIKAASPFRAMKKYDPFYWNAIAHFNRVYSSNQKLWLWMRSRLLQQSARLEARIR